MCVYKCKYILYNFTIRYSEQNNSKNKFPNFTENIRKGMMLKIQMIFNKKKTTKSKENRTSSIYRYLIFAVDVYKYVT